MKRSTNIRIAMALVLALIAAPLVACAGNGGSDGGSAPSGSSSASIDVSSLKTLGDVLALDDETMAASWSDTAYVYCVKSGDTYIRAVAKLTPEVSEQLNALDMSADDFDEQRTNVLADVPLESVEDVTSQMATQDELNALVGKTGQDLVDAGYTFNYYFMTGGEETGVLFDNGFFSYCFTFDVSVPDSDVDGDGAAVMNATIVEASVSGFSDAASSPSNVQ